MKAATLEKKEGRKPRASKVFHMKRHAPRFNKKLDALADSMLDHAQTVFDQSLTLDTAVRDIVAQGLAYFVHAAYDTKACANGISDFEFVGYIESHVHEWFRARGFVGWFCIGASTLFRTSTRAYLREKRNSG